MRIRYSKFKTSSKVFDAFYRPLLNIRLINKTNIREQKALLDTGADYILINSSIAKDLGINYKTGILIHTIGIDARPLDTYFHEIEMEVVDLENSRFKTYVGFINSSSVGILLGQKGFFDNIKIFFNKSANYFDVNL